MSCETNPFSQFHKWFLEAQAAELKEPNAMSLATTTPAGKPSNRIVLLKEASEEGFIFYTSYTSRKGRELKRIRNALPLSSGWNSKGRSGSRDEQNV